MNSEKVKEIKEALEQNSGYIPFFNEYEVLDDVSYADILTLINELKSENERLSSRYRNLEINYNDTWEHYREYEVENQQLKDRIAELEKGNAKLLDSVETVQSNRCVYKCVLTKEHLTKFAERLKEKFYYVFGNEYEQSVSGFDTKVLIEHIDETLKEFIDE